MANGPCEPASARRSANVCPAHFCASSSAPTRTATDKGVRRMGSSSCTRVRLGAGYKSAESLQVRGVGRALRARNAQSKYIPSTTVACQAFCCLPMHKQQHTACAHSHVIYATTVPLNTSSAASECREITIGGTQVTGHVDTFTGAALPQSPRGMWHTTKRSCTSTRRQHAHLLCWPLESG